MRKTDKKQTRRKKLYTKPKLESLGNLKQIIRGVSGGIPDFDQVGSFN